MISRQGLDPGIGRDGFVGHPNDIAAKNLKNGPIRHSFFQTACIASEGQRELRIMHDHPVVGIEQCKSIGKNADGIGKTAIGTLRRPFHVDACRFVRFSLGDIRDGAGDAVYPSVGIANRTSAQMDPQPGSVLAAQFRLKRKAVRFAPKMGCESLALLQGEIRMPQQPPCFGIVVQVGVGVSEHFL